MEKRVVVFLIVSLAIIIGYDYLLKGMGLLPPSEPVQVATTGTSSGATNQPSGLENGAAQSASAEATTSSPASAKPAPIDNAAGAVKEEQTVEVDTELFRAKFSTRGAVLKSWELKRYT